MDSSSVQLEWTETAAERARALCETFLQCHPAKRFLMGRNPYSAAVAKQLEVAGFVDDFTSEKTYHGRPILRLQDLPSDAVVLAASGGRPLTVRKLLDDRNIRNIDYFALHKWSGLDLPEAVFNEGFAQEFEANRAKIDWLFDRLADEESKQTLRKLLSFRYTYELDCLEGFTERQREQYFEPFFKVSGGKPVFVDVGGFDGFTSEEFIRYAPDYHAVYMFEPEETNRATCQERLSGRKNIHLLPYGAGREDAVLRFSSDGSASALRDDGESEIHIRRIDDLVAERPTFLKMDIEGAELMALEGARGLIARDQPTLAIAVYHRPSDMWNIPSKIVEISSDYKIYLRHYTESIYETVMYFVPPEYERH